MACESCKSERVVHAGAKCSDMFHFTVYDGEKTLAEQDDGYVPGWLGIGKGDYVSISFCFDCGKLCNYKPGEVPDGSKT